MLPHLDVILLPAVPCGKNLLPYFEVPTNFVAACLSTSASNYTSHEVATEGSMDSPTATEEVHVCQVLHVSFKYASVPGPFTVFSEALLRHQITEVQPQSLKHTVSNFKHFETHVFHQTYKMCNVL